MANASQQGRRTEYRPLRDLKTNPDNPKAHDLETINESVARFGYIESVVIDERTGYLISGHGRHKTLQAMRARGDAPPDGVVVGPDGDWLVPVQLGWASRTDAEARAALIALNRTTELGGWVDDALFDLLDGMDDYTGVGFTEDDTDDLRARLEELGDEPAPELDQDGEVPAQRHPDKVATGSRLIIMDYSVSEYPIVQERLRTLRSDFGVDNDAAAIAALLAERYPGSDLEQVPAAEL